jgi:hypothetical protein
VLWLHASGRKRKEQHATGVVTPSLAGVASKFADYAVSVLEGIQHGHEGTCAAEQQQTPSTATRTARSALDILRWNAEATVGAVARRAKRQKKDDESQLHLVWS